MSSYFLMLLLFVPRCFFGNVWKSWLNTWPQIWTKAGQKCCRLFVRQRSISKNCEKLFLFQHFLWSCQYYTIPITFQIVPILWFLICIQIPDGSWSACLHVAWRERQEEQAVGSAIRRLCHDLRPENRQRRNPLSDETRTWVPFKFWPNSEENPEAFVPCGGSHLPLPLPRGELKECGLN